MKKRTIIGLDRRKFIASSIALSVSGLCRSVSAKSLKNKPDFHPGHYIALKSGRQIGGIKRNHLEAITGVSKRYRWVTLEPKLGVYDFSSIEKDLKALGGKQLVAFLIDKSHGQLCLPEYLHDHRFKGSKGLCPMRWKPYYAERYAALSAAIAAEFDELPCFEGIAMQETALPSPKETLAEVGYTPELYKQNLLRMIIASKKAMKHSQFFWYTNFIPGDSGEILEQMIERLIPHEVVVGGPDILPYRRHLKNLNYPLYKKYKDAVPLFCSAQEDSFAHHKNDTRNNGPNEIRGNKGIPDIHPDGVLSMREIYEFAVKNLHVNYIFWNYYFPDDPRQRSFDDVYPIIKQNPSFNRGNM